MAKDKDSYLTFQIRDNPGQPCCCTFSNMILSIVRSRLVLTSSTCQTAAGWEGGHVGGRASFSLKQLPAECGAMYYNLSTGEVEMEDNKIKGSLDKNLSQNKTLKGLHSVLGGGCWEREQGS